MPPGLRLVLDENFELNKLDPALWSIGEPWHQAPGVQQGPDAWLPLPPPPGLIEVSNGTLKLRAKTSTKPGYKVDAGFVTTRGKFDFRYGYIETKVLLPSAAGLWPAFWLLGNGTGLDGWPRCGEVDIFEVLQAVSPGVPFRTDHWADKSGSHVQHTVGDSPGEPWPTAIPNYDKAWTKFGLLRAPDRLETYINDKLMFTTTRITKNAQGLTPGEVVFDAPMHVRFDLSAGKWDQKAPSVSPGQFEVDYLRAWVL